MPAWGYFVIGFIVLALVLLTFRRNTPVTHSTTSDYGADYRRVLEDVAPVVDDLRDALRSGEERRLAMAAAKARSRVHAGIGDLDRLLIPESIPEDERETLEAVRLKIQQGLSNYEWAARIAETTDPLENDGLRRGFGTLMAMGDQLVVEARFALAAAPESVASEPVQG